MQIRRGLALIGVPSSAGARRTGLEAGPEALRAAGLTDALRRQGFDVGDLGDLPVATFRPDHVNPRRQNRSLVIGVALQVADLVDQALRQGRLPLVIGGDCSITLGITAGLLRHHRRLGLVYFDGDVDLNTPETTPSGAFDGMVMAHLLGRGDAALTDIGPRRPLLSEEDVVLFGYDADSGWIDPPEIEALQRSGIHRVPLEEVRSEPSRAARRALELLGPGCRALLVHFDVDVTDIPATDVLHPGGLSLDSAFEALQVLLTSPDCAAIAITELNPERDQDRSWTKRLVEGFVQALGASREWAA